MDHEHADHVASDANTIARWRELLGEDAEGLSDDEVEQIRRHADAMARVIVEIFLERAAQGVAGSEPRTDHLAAP